MLQDRLTEILLQKGAVAVGFADISELPAEERRGYNYALSIVEALNPAIISTISGGPTREYCLEYKRANTLLTRLGQLGADILKEQGYRAVPLKPTGEDFDTETLSAGLSHKAVATRAGLGWIGKSALLISKKFGAAIRLNSVLTDAVFKTASPVNDSRCGDCATCVKACPGQAILNRNWQVGMSRESLLNASACCQTAKSYTASLKIDSTICGVCIAVCPWTRKYLSRESGK